MLDTVCVGLESAAMNLAIIEDQNASKPKTPPRASMMTMRFSIVRFQA